MKDHAKPLENFQETIFATMSKLAADAGAINLSQGFPDFDGPDWIKNLATDAMQQGLNQYAPSMGLPSLRNIVAGNMRELYGMDVDPDREVTITSGATEAIYCTITALVNPGDEVILFEPYYDSYKASVELAGGKVVAVTLKKDKNFSWDSEELNSAFNDKTKLVIINSPHNPSGKMFSHKEIEELSTLVNKFDTYLISDEVYEFLIFDDNKHIPPATLSSLKDRTITISSTGKTFGLTGWKIGWTVAPASLTHSIRMVHQFTTFSVATPFQHAVGEALKKINEYKAGFKKDYQQKRDFFVGGLKELGWNPMAPQGTYFVMCPFDHLSDKDDITFCKELIETKRVAAIPPSAFYSKSDEGTKLVRFCFAKKQETLEEALRRLRS